MFDFLQFSTEKTLNPDNQDEFEEKSLLRKMASGQASLEQNKQKKLLTQLTSS